MVRKLRSAFSILLALLLAGCADYVIDSDYTPEVDFTTLKTYRWYSAQPRDPQSLEYLGGAVIDKRIRQVIDDALQARGFVQQDQDQDEVDFAVNYDILTEDRQDVRTYNTYGGYAPGGNSGYGPMATTSTQVISYKQGQLIIDIIEPADQVLLWRGTAEGRLSRSRSAARRERNIREIVSRVLADFPPRTRLHSTNQPRTSP